MQSKMTMKSTIGCMVLGLSLLSLPAFATTDYSGMSNEELAAKRGTMRDAPPDDQDAFRAEWRERVNAMSVEERQSAVGRPENAPQDGAGRQYRQGGGKGYSHGAGRGCKQNSGANN